ncbi:MAG: hypothetical protein DCC74_10840 [Proteobacteria bacterium]|nr:MAG: hypothetical protein DCC74_10840 [Pseudomonadota bacterium]
MARSSIALRISRSACSGRTPRFRRSKAFSSEVETGSREENASKQQSGALLLIPSKAKKL